MLTIYTAALHLPEKDYVFHVVFREMLGVEYQIRHDSNEIHHRISLPNGAELVIENHFWHGGPRPAPPAPESIPAPVPHPFHPGEDIAGIYGIPVFTVEDQRIVCQLDLFASIFFMLTRWEENDPAARDQHGRFPAEKSLAFRAGFLHRPVVNEWVDLIAQMLQHLGWQHTRPIRSYRLSVSCDVDHPRLWWSAADRLRTLGGAVLKRGNILEAGYFLKNYWFGQKDPYDIFDEWFELFARHQVVAQFNFLGSRPRSSDCWYPLDHPFIIRLMEKMTRHGHQIGFHPGYETFQNEAVFKQELASLQAVSPVKISGGRQHYLRFEAPGTWRMWQEAGLSWDSTLGYPEAEGFRCGICHDYPVFDIEAQKMLDLREKPLLAMDVTLAQYRQYTPEQATEQLASLRRQVARHGGEFTLLWHNSSWNTPFWEPWKKVFLDSIAGT